MNQEIWKPVVGFEGAYEVSNLGNVRSVNRTVVSSNGVKKHMKGKNRKLHSTYGGYQVVFLFKDGKPKAYPVNVIRNKAFEATQLSLFDEKHVHNSKTIEMGNLTITITLNDSKLDIKVNQSEV